MQATEFLELSRDPAQWRKHARSLRASAELLWSNFANLLASEATRVRDSGAEPDLSAVFDALETTKLLYGLSLETALKARIFEHFPEKVELRVVIDGAGEPKQAELRTIGVPTSNGHNILALAEAAGIFSEDFQTTVATINEANILKNIFRDLSEVVLWRGRYPVPLGSGSQIQLDPSAPGRTLATYMRDWLDPLLDALLVERDTDA